ncbi:unnamed protein product [Amoebophrya sp. A120]|nr:unnamed protein product [Amoebophrya sp. A120]|eukprot:GSA120T00002985001.1
MSTRRLFYSCQLALLHSALTVRAMVDLESLMSSINAYKEGQDTCASCVAAGKEWCLVWDACDVDECEEEDVIIQDCASVDILPKRPELAPGVLVEVLPPREEFFLEGETEKFVQQMREMDDFLLPENATLKPPVGDQEASGSTIHQQNATTPAHLSTFERFGFDEAAVSSANKTNAAPIIGVVVRAYHTLDEFTVRDDAGFEIKHRLRHGPVTNPQKFNDQPYGGVQEKEPVYFRSSELRVLSSVRKGDRVRGRFWTRKSRPSVRVEEAEVLNSTDVHQVRLRYLEDDTDAYVPRTFVLGLSATDSNGSLLSSTADSRDALPDVDSNASCPVDPSGLDTLGQRGNSKCVAALPVIE